MSSLSLSLSLSSSENPLSLPSTIRPPSLSISGRRRPLIAAATDGSFKCPLCGTLFRSYKAAVVDITSTSSTDLTLIAPAPAPAPAKKTLLSCLGKEFKSRTISTDFNKLCFNEKVSKVLMNVGIGAIGSIFLAFCGAAFPNIYAHMGKRKMLPSICMPVEEEKNLTKEQKSEIGDLIEELLAKKEKEKKEDKKSK